MLNYLDFLSLVLKNGDPKQSFTQPQADDGTQTIAAV